MSVPNLATSPYCSLDHDPQHRHTCMHTPVCSTMDRDGSASAPPRVVVSLSHPASWWTEFLGRLRNFVPLCQSGSSSVVETSKLATGGGAPEEVLLLRRAHRGEKIKAWWPSAGPGGWRPWFLCPVAPRRFARPGGVCPIACYQKQTILVIYHDTPFYLVSAGTYFWLKWNR